MATLLAERQQSSNLTSQMNNNSKRMLKSWNGAIAIIAIISAIFFLPSCLDGECKTIETYPDGQEKTRGCIVSSLAEHYCYTDYYKSGIVKSEYCLKMGELEGIRVFYYESGAVKSQYPYKNGLRHGLAKEYFKDGRKNFFNFYLNDRPMYGRFYRYDSSEVYFEPVYNPVVEVMADTVALFSESSLEFTVSMPLPDSLLRRNFSIFMYDLKPLALKDSVLYTPKYQDTLYYDKPLRGRIKPEQPGKQIFYGYVGEYYDDGDKVHAYSPFEKEIVVEE